MTANQIAYASVKEAERHNQATESELNRHNVASERISDEVNRINDQANTITEFYQNERNRIQEKYNDAYIELQKSQGQRRLDLQEELNLIEADKNRINENYNNEMVTINQRRNQIDADKAYEIARHNEAMEAIEGSKAAFTFLVETKRNEYTATYYRDLVSIQQEQNRVRELQVTNDFFLQSQKINLEAEKQGYQIDLFQAQTKESNARRGLLDAQAYGTAKENFWIDWNNGPGRTLNGLLPSGRYYLK